jgi:putative MATE family efflux protein
LASRKPAPSNAAKFLTGSIMMHIVVMTTATAAGLLSIFAVDFINLYFLSLLHEVEVTAAVGYAGSIVFFSISIGIGLAIAAAALVAPAIGRHDPSSAGRLTVNMHVFTFAVTAVLSAVIWFYLPELLTSLGATGRTHELATTYLRIVIPSTPLLALGMCASAVLRAAGDAKRSMYVTLFGAIASAALDPVFILWLGMGVKGAAIASVIARCIMVATGFYCVAIAGNLVQSWKVRNFAGDLRAMVAIAVPAILTNLATPVANAYVTSAMAAYGDDAVAAWAILGRLMPLSFAAIFALTGAVGPIVGQNRGAGDFDRVRLTISNALLFTAIYTAFIWLMLGLLRGHVAAVFGASGDGIELIAYYCIWITPLTAFLGGQFVANAAFNNLGKPQFSTMLNWSRATAGTMPLVMACAYYEGAKGVLLGYNLAGVIFGTLSVILCYRHISNMAREAGYAPVPLHA